MKMKSRILSLFLAMLMFTSVFAAFPPIEVSAANGTVPQAVWVKPTQGEDYVILKGAVADDGGSPITRYGFGYQVVGIHSSYVWEMVEGTIAENKAFSHRIDDLEPGDVINYVIVAGNKYGEGKSYSSTKTKEKFEVSTDEMEFEADGGKDTFKITASSKYTLIVSNPWITVSESSGSSNKTITVTCKKNTGTSSRTGYIKVKHIANEEIHTIDISQEGKKDELEVSEDYFEFEASGGKDTFIVYASDEYTISSNSAWLTTSLSSGSTEQTITITCKANTTPWERYGEITVTLTSTGEKSVIDVYQYGAEDDGGGDSSDAWLDVDKSTIAASNKQSTYVLSITSNITNWTVTDNADWLSVSPTAGNNNASITISVSENQKETSRTGVITISGSGITKTVYVTQVGAIIDDSLILGDINNDGEITNKDRFLLNRYLANMAGYTNINKIVADINGDGNVTDDDAVILERHLFGWIGYEDLDVFHNTTTVPPTDVPKWDMSFSSNAVTIELVLKEGTLEKNKNYLFIAENSKGLHYTGIIEAGQTSASFSVKAMQMPRGEMYSYYIIPEGLVLAGNKDTYCIGKSVVPLFKGNMITSVKSGDRTIAKNGYVFIGDGLTINWDGSYGVDNFKLVVTLNGSEIYNKTFNHDGPGTVTISADKISSKGTGTLIISGYVEPSSASGLATAVSVWTGNVVEAEKATDSEVDPVDLLNEDALALYNKSEAVAYLQLETYYYWQAFADELNSGRYWESYRSDISNIVNGLFSSPTTLIFDSNAKALIKQAVRTKLLQETKSENALFTSISTYYKDVTSLLPSTVNNIAIPGIVAIFKSGQSIGGDKQNDIILMLAKKIDYRTVNTQNVDKILNVLNNTSVNYNGTTYYLSQFYNINHDTAFELKVQLGAIKKAETVSDQMALIENSKKTYAINADKIDTTNSVGQKLDKILKAVEWTGRGVFHLNDMCSLWALSNQFDEYEKLLNEMVASSDGVFKEAIQETIYELRKEAYLQVLAETAWDTIRLAVDEIYGEVVVKALQKNPYVLLATVSNGIFTTLANTDAVNKGELTLPHIVEAMNDTISKIEYTYSLFMMNPTNARYYELESLFHTYQFQVELGAEIYMNLSLADHNSYLKRFVRFINPFDKEDKMPETIQGCYDEDIKKLNYVLTWFGFN